MVAAAMLTLPTRQVHLDFHTSELFPGVGSRFNKANFQEALRTGHVNSVTVFARCHHGWCYYPTRVGRMHPTLTFDLTGAMMEAAHEIGVRAPVYVTNGWIAQEVPDHPDWLARNRDGSPMTINTDPNAAPDDPRPNCSWHNACPNTGYAEYQYALLTEICDRYPRLDGFFIDINAWAPCYCQACLASLRQQGLDPDANSDVDALFREVWRRFFDTASQLIRSRHPDASVFFNHCADPYHPERFPYQTHFEIEDMPTVWAGYDRIPFRAKFFSKIGLDFVGQTGKFHQVWGEFGTYKAANALLYECATLSAFGAKLNVGDQLHPEGEMNLSTYRLIGKVYELMEQIEPFCHGGVGTSRLGMVLSGHSDSDLGLSRMLLESQLDFDVVMPGEDLGRYDVVILPDSVRLAGDAAERYRAFAAVGGGILLTGTSGLDPAGERFVLDVGATWEGPSPFDDDYLSVLPEVLQNANESLRQRGLLREELPSEPLLCYEAAGRVAITDGSPLAFVVDPHFNRRYRHYCGHRNTPYPLSDPAGTATHPGAVQKGRVIWMGHPLCRVYHRFGAQLHREWTIAMLRRLYSFPVVEVEAPSQARINFVRQPHEQRYVLHITYASPIQRGEVRVIEDLVPLRDVPVTVRLREHVKRVFLAPEGTALAFSQQAGVVRCQIPRVLCHQIVVFEV